MRGRGSAGRKVFAVNGIHDLRAVHHSATRQAGKPEPALHEMQSAGRCGAVLRQQALDVLALPLPEFQVEHPADGIDHELGVDGV
jgi:hypothetical protein